MKTAIGAALLNFYSKCSRLSLPERKIVWNSSQRNPELANRRLKLVKLTIYSFDIIKIVLL
jgi:hypothetical protein